MQRFRGFESFIVLAVVLTLGLPAPVTHGEEVLPGEITDVTVYRDLARVVRHLEIPAADEIQQVRVTGLPSHLVARSTFTEADDGTAVRSVQIIPRPGPSDPEDKTQLEQRRIEKAELLKELHGREHRFKVIEQDLLTLEKLVDFSADKVEQNLDRATLDVESVTALADFTMARRRELADELLQAQTEIERLKRDIAENEHEQTRLMTDDANAGYQALLAVLAPAGGTVRLVYDVGHVDWTPRYSIRAVEGAGGSRSFRLQFDAVLVQDSGEPWKNVALTLSTSRPDREAARPLLAPLRVRAKSAGEQRTQLTATGKVDFHRPDWLDRGLLEHHAQLNAVASQRQVTELTSVVEIQRKLAGDAGEDLADEAYGIAERMEIANHPRPQTITILSSDLPGKMNHVVTPLLSSFAFREAELTNSSGKNLIAGDVDVYLDNDFIGHTTLSPTAAGQRLTIGFGTDRQIRTRRELLAKEETVQGGNRRSTLTHRLVIANYHATPIAVQLLDRIPIAGQDGSISVELDDSSAAALSDDPLYTRMQRPTGVLRWDLQIPANRFGSHAFDHEYSYSVELDRHETIVANDPLQTLSDLEFQKMNMGGGMGGGGSF